MNKLNRIFSRINNLFFLYSLKQKNLLKIGKHSYVNQSSCFEGENIIRTDTTLLNTSLGYGTYIGNRCLFVNSNIGRFCSIGDEVRIVRGQHPSRVFVSTHPAFYSINSSLSFVNEGKFDDFSFADDKNKLSLIIENDVWIGTGVRILEGVTIGNGAIIASGAVVTKDVSPYTIVGGVPAKVISKRFDDLTIDRLLSFKWWDRSTEWIKENAEKFQNIECFFEN